MYPRTLAWTLVCLLAFCLPWSTLASDDPATALLTKPERIVLFATGSGEDDDDTFPVFRVHFDLVDKAQQPKGTLDVSGIATQPRPQNPGDPEPAAIITFVASLSDGSVVGQGVMKADDQPFMVAIVGGTGRYRRARGQARVVPKEDDGARIVLHLLP